MTESRDARFNQYPIKLEGVYLPLKDSILFKSAVVVQNATKIAAALVQTVAVSSNPTLAMQLNRMVSGFSYLPLLRGPYLAYPLFI